MDDNLTSFEKLQATPPMPSAPTLLFPLRKLLHTLTPITSNPRKDKTGHRPPKEHCIDSGGTVFSVRTGQPAQQPLKWIFRCIHCNTAYTDGSYISVR